MNLLGIAWKFFKLKKGRSFFSVLGISLGIMMLIISQILLFTVEKSNEATVRQKYGNFDMLVGYQTNKQYLAQEDLAFINNIPGVIQSSSLLYPYLVKDKSQSELLDMPVYVGLKNDSLSKELPFHHIGEGAFPKENEVVLSQSYLKSNGLNIGSIIDLPFPPNGTKQVKISGTFNQSEKLDYYALFNYDWLSQVTSNENKATVAMLKLSDPSEITEITYELKDRFSDIFIDARQEMVKAKENIGGLKPFIQILTIGSLIGSILIVISTLQMAVQERQRDLATLRLLGAQKSHLFILILFESLIIGILAGVASTLIGVQAASLSKEFVEQLMQVQISEVVVPWNQVMTSAVIGVLLTVLAGLIPAYSATKLPPIAAYRQSAEPLERINPFITAAGLILFVVSSFITCLNYFYFHGSSRTYLFAGIMFLISMFLNIPIVILSTAKLFSFITQPFLGSEGYISGKNVLRQLKRSIQITSILVLALSVGFTGSMLFHSVVVQAEESIRNEHLTDYTIRSSESSLEPGYPAELAEQLQQIHGVESIAVPTSLFGLTLNLNQEYAAKNWNGQFHQINGHKQAQISLGAIDMETANRFKPIKVLEGTISQNALRDNGVVITKEVKDIGYKLGDTIQIGRFDDVQKGAKGHSFKVVGVIENIPILPTEEFKIYTDASNLEKYFGINKLQQIQYNITLKDQTETIQNQVETLLKDPRFSTTMLYDKTKELEQLRTEATQRMLILLIVVVLMTCIAIIGLMNSMASSLQERKREFAVLRAIGSRRKQVIRLALFEGMIITISGGVIGIISGVGLGYQILAALEAEYYIFPLSLIVIGLCASPIIGILAALSPSLWLAKLKLMQTLRAD
ncbi:FtsX-like permease family protein [Paenibacillus azoreducens]|uniref:FtsX-like permease family protein n=1 Tax=Paenibacillus azoreducens TaxID=116718 RepID=A0A919YGL5_9BACL|nr:FtsX-like permease family protein [Paenibacillus azoreducens]GIO48830.1 hypothetical protein J34TS1_35950 [Paenibacillus azoreducens]